MRIPAIGTAVRHMAALSPRHFSANSVRHYIYFMHYPGIPAISMIPSSLSFSTVFGHLFMIGGTQHKGFKCGRYLTSPMMPAHCKNVSVKNVSFSLTIDNITRHIKGKKAYTTTEYFVLKNRQTVAVIGVTKEECMELLRPIVGFEIISLPSSTIYVEDPRIDVLSASQMAKLSLEHKGKTIVVSGMFNHVSFVRDEKPIELVVLDVVPPYPSKLSVLVEKALEMDVSEHPVVMIVENIDLNALADNVETSGVVFPCRASGITSRKPIFFLDETPEIVTDVTLIGCDLSKRIFLSYYKKNVPHIDMCPKDLAPEDGRARIVKCCRLKKGFELKGRMAIVPWGATIKEVADALRALIHQDCRNKE